MKKNYFVKMIMQVFLMVLFVNFDSYAQGFSTTASNWGLPSGGYLSGGTDYSFYNLYGGSTSSNDNGSQFWTTVEMNGDGKPDLVVYQEYQSGAYNVYGLPNNPYWKVYLNTGSGFSTTAINWALPPGGYLNGGTNYSFSNLYYGSSSNGDNGSQQWTTTDMNDDGKIDLVVYQEKQSGTFNVYGLPGNPYWKVYLNIGSGFSTTATNWGLPPGGYVNGGTNYSFSNLYYGSSSNGDNGSQQWTTSEMNGDGKPDLVVYQEKQNGTFNVYGLPGNPYWKVYLNTGSGFSTTATTWGLPPGGFLNIGTNYSFYNLYGGSTSSGDNGSQLWTTSEMNGDGKPDLVVYSERQSGIYNVYGLPANPYWKVYLNAGSGFSTTAINWVLPPGGYSIGGTFYSFYNLYGGSTNSNDNGSQFWTTVEMNGDGKPDLVVYQEYQSGAYNVYGLPSNPYWKMYLNSGSGFSSTAINWGLPSGGYSIGGTFYSFYNLYGGSTSSNDNGSQFWTTVEMNGDGKPDLVVYQEYQSGAYNVYGLPSNPYWKVYLNNSNIIGISQVENNSHDLTINPNPSNGKFIIEHHNDFMNMNAEIYNSSGEKVIEQSSSFEIDLTHYPNGFYFAKIYHGEKTCIKKLIKE